MLFFTGFSRFSSDIQVEAEKSLKSKEAQLLEMLQLVDEAEQVLTSKTDLTEFGKLLDYTWKLKRGITSKVSTDSIDAIYDKAIKAGATGGKLLVRVVEDFCCFMLRQTNRKMYMRHWRICYTFRLSLRRLEHR